MISLYNKMFITRKIVSVVNRYATTSILPKLFKEYSFDSGNISELIKDISYYDGDIPPPDQQLELEALIESFLNGLKENDATALYLWFIDNNYDYYFEEFDIDSYDDDEQDEELGKYFSSMLEHPGSDFKIEIIEKLKELLIRFSSEFDFSEIDEESYETIEDTIKYYCR